MAWSSTWLGRGAGGPVRRLASWTSGPAPMLALRSRRQLPAGATPRASAPTWATTGHLRLARRPRWKGPRRAWPWRSPRRPGALPSRELETTARPVGSHRQLMQQGGVAFAGAGPALAAARTSHPLRGSASVRRCARRPGCVRGARRRGRRSPPRRGRVLRRRARLGNGHQLALRAPCRRRSPRGGLTWSRTCTATRCAPCAAPTRPGGRCCWGSSARAGQSGRRQRSGSGGAGATASATAGTRRRAGRCSSGRGRERAPEFWRFGELRRALRGFR